ncbi:hypothetical protein F4819DRAFT_355340 [Hypoxylon fuscum]|nr:hypothetical protein F4819DRAFT_355340 [Hypoxylon fuscum]
MATPCSCGLSNSLSPPSSPILSSISVLGILALIRTYLNALFRLSSPPPNSSRRMLRGVSEHTYSKTTHLLSATIVRSLMARGGFLALSLSLILLAFRLPTHLHFFFSLS